MKIRMFVALTLFAILGLVAVGCSEENADATDTPTEDTQATPNEPAATPDEPAATDESGEAPENAPAAPEDAPAEEPVSEAQQQHKSKLTVLHEQLGVSEADAAKIVEFCELRKQVPDADVQITMTYSVKLDNDKPEKLVDLRK